MIQTSPSNPLPAGERYGHVYHTSDGEVIHGIKKIPGEHLPRGSFAKVKWARNLQTGALLARRICVINDPKNLRYTVRRQQRSRNAAEKCIKILEELRGIPGIVPYHGYERYINKNGKEKIVFFFDKANCDLLTLLNNTKKKPLDRSTQLSFAKQLLEVLHRLKGAHGDFKSANILEKDGHLWLSDFDFYSATTGPCDHGSLSHAAPEVIETGQCQDLRKKDVWGLGITLFFIFTNTLEHSGKAPTGYHFPWFSVKLDGIEVALRMISQFNPEEFSKVLEAKIATPEVCHLLSMMLQPDPAKRYTIDEAYEYFMTHIQPGRITDQMKTPEPEAAAALDPKVQASPESQS